MKRYILVGVALGIAIVLVVGAMIDYRALNTTQFGTNAGIASIMSGAIVTNAHDTGTLTASNEIVTNRIGIATATATESLTVGNAGNGIGVYDTADQTVNYRRLSLAVGFGLGTVSFNKGGTAPEGTLRLVNGTADTLGSTLIDVKVDRVLFMVDATNRATLDTNAFRTGTGVLSNQFTLLTNPVSFGVLRADAGGTNFNGTTNVSDLQVTNLTVNNVTINNSFTVNGKNGLAGSGTATFIPMYGTSSILSNSIAEQQGTTNIIVRGSVQATNNIAAQSGVFSNSFTLLSGAGAERVMTDVNGTGVGTWASASTTAIPHYKTRRTTIALPTGTGAGITIIGDSATITGSGSTATVGTNATAVSLGTGAASQADGGLSGNGNYRCERNISFFFRGSIQSNIQERVFIGLSSAGLSTAVDEDTGGGAVNYFGFQYSTPRADANWQVVTKDGGTQVIHDSGVAMTTNEFTMEMYYDVSIAASNIVFKINGATVDTRASTNMPAGGVGYSYVLGIETQDSLDKRILVSGMEVSADK